MEYTEYFRFVLALVGVLGLIGLVAMVAKRIVPGMSAVNLGPTRRIGLVEVIALDHRRKLVLLKRDDTEHLVILGPTTETVVETGITPPQEESRS